MNRITAMIVFVSMLSAAPLPALADVVVIVNPSIGFESLAEADVLRLFLGKTKSLPNQKTAVMVAQKEGSPTRAMFDKNVLKKTPNQMKAYWSQLIFTGRATPPNELGDDAQVKKLVAENPNIVGYIDGASLDGTVKAVYTAK